MKQIKKNEYSVLHDLQYHLPFGIVCNMYKYHSFLIMPPPPRGRRGFKSRIHTPYPQRVVKGDLTGTA